MKFRISVQMVLLSEPVRGLLEGPDALASDARVRCPPTSRGLRRPWGIHVCVVDEDHACSLASRERAERVDHLEPRIRSVDVTRLSRIARTAKPVQEFPPCLPEVRSSEVDRHLEGEVFRMSSDSMSPHRSSNLVTPPCEVLTGRGVPRHQRRRSRDFSKWIWKNGSKSVRRSTASPARSTLAHLPFLLPGRRDRVHVKRSRSPACMVDHGGTTRERTRPAPARTRCSGIPIRFGVARSAGYDRRRPSRATAGRTHPVVGAPLPRASAPCLRPDRLADRGIDHVTPSSMLTSTRTMRDVPDHARPFTATLAPRTRRPASSGSRRLHQGAGKHAGDALTGYASS